MHPACDFMRTSYAVMKPLLSVAAVLVCLFLGACASRPPLATVKRVDLKRYAGTWHEIARYPNYFQRHCAENVTAEYVAQTDGSIKVINSCLQKNGKKEQAIGRATVVPGSGNAKLKVSFFGPFTGDYWVIGLDEKNYSWAVVGHPSRKYLWILAREKQLPSKTYESILQLIRDRGYDTGKLMKTTNIPPCAH